MDLSIRIKAFCLGCYILMSLTLGMSMMMMPAGQEDMLNYAQIAKEKGVNGPHTPAEAVAQDTATKQLTLAQASYE